MLFLASLRRAYKLSYTTCRPTKAFGYAIESRLQSHPYGSKSTNNSKFCKGKKSGKKAKRHVERWKRGTSSKKKLSRNASTLSPVALISDKDTSPTTIALIPISLFEEHQSDHDAFRDAFAILALLKKKSQQVELFMESYNNLREGSTTEKFMSESPYVTELDQLDKEILATTGKREKEQHTSNERNQHLDLKDVPVAGLQLNFEMNMTNIRDAILYPENVKQIRDKPFSDEEDSRLVLSTNVRVDPDNKAAIPLQLTALIHGTVHIDPTKFSKEMLGRLDVSQFNKYVTAVAATLCSKALQKGFPMKTETLGEFERTDKSFKPASQVNKVEGGSKGTTFEVVDVAELFDSPQLGARLASTVDSSHEESVDRTQANNLISRLDDLMSAVKAGTHDHVVDKNVGIADDFVEQAERSAESKERSERTTNIGRNLTKEGIAGPEITGKIQEEIGRNEVSAVEETLKSANRKVFPADRSWKTSEKGELKAETIENKEATIRTVVTDDAESIVANARHKSQASAAFPYKGENGENVESTEKDVSEVGKTKEDLLERTSKPTLERKTNAPRVKAYTEGTEDSEERRIFAKEMLLEAQARRANSRGRSVNVEKTTPSASPEAAEREGSVIRNSAPMAGPLGAPSRERAKERIPEEAVEMRSQTNVSTAKTSEALEKHQKASNSLEKLSKPPHTLETAVPLEKNADLLEKMIDALESKFQPAHNEKITSSSSSVQAEIDKSEIARQIELSKGLNADIELSKYSNESSEFSKTPNELYEVLSDVDQMRNVKATRLDPDGHSPKEPNKDEVKRLQRKFYQFKGELYNLNTFNGQPSSYAIGLGSAAAIPGKGKSGDKETNRDPHIVCVRNGSKGCTSPGLSENTFYVAKKTSPSDAGSKTSEISLRGMHQRSPDEVSSKRHADKMGTRLCSTTSKSESDKKKGSVCGSTPPCQNKTKKQQLPPVKKKPSGTKCSDPCKRSPCEQSKSEDSCKRSICISKKKSSSCGSNKSDPCKRSSFKSKDPCKKTDPCTTSMSSSKKSDHCKRSSTESKDPCEMSSSSTLKKADPCKRSSSESKDPCKTSSSSSKKSDPCKITSSKSNDACKRSSSSDPCKRSSSESKNPCKRSSSATSKKTDPCKRSSSESKDPCKTSSKKSDPCKITSSKSNNPCKRSSSASSKKTDPCKRSSSKSNDPCKTSSSSSMKSDPCKRSLSKSKDPCKRSSSSDPCKRSSSESKDPCKTSSSSSKKSDPCKITSSKSNNPCKRSSSSDPCKRSSSESKDPCKTSSKKFDPCKITSSKSNDPCKRSSSASSKKTDPCKRSSSKSNDPCKTSSSSSMKSDPCKKSLSKSKDPCKRSSSSDPESKDPCKISSSSSKKSDPCKITSSNSYDPCKRSSSPASKKPVPCEISSSKSNDLCKVSSLSSSTKFDRCKKASSKSSEDVKNKEAIILSPYKICRRTIPIKPVNENDVRVCIESVALSDSDIHMFETGAKKYPGITLGNEASGIVEKVGKKVKHLRAGDHVALECGIPCGGCSLCRSGHYNLCEKLTFKGCLKKYCTHPASFCHKISKSVPLPSAALGYQLSLGCNACAQAGIKPNSNVAIIGSCAMTLCTAMCANAMGCSNVCVICTTPDTHDIVTENITNKVACIDSQTTAKGIYQRICDSLRTHPDVVINCSCSTKTMNASVMALKPNGTCVVCGCLCECATYNMMDALMKEIRIIPSFRCKNMFPFAVHLLERGQVPIDCIIAECREWKELEAGFQKALTENNCGPRKVIVQCHAGNEGDGDARKS